MIRDYRLASPSLGGILSHESLSYDGLRRPPELARIFDRPSGLPSVMSEGDSAAQRKVVAQYFHDLYGVFLKKLSGFAVEDSPSPDEGVKLQAMLQELIKVKAILGSK